MDRSPKVVMIYVTFKNAAEAKKISKHIVENGLAACANILGASESIYIWDGKLESKQEVSALFKCAAEVARKTMAEIKKLHSYECPCILEIPIMRGSVDFLKWIKEANTRASSKT